MKMTDEALVNRNSSKGNQLKWKENDTWYKADYLGYESLSEYMVSGLLHKTNVPDFVDYEIANINYHDRDFTGCSSKHFLKENESIVTLSKLFTMYYNEDISSKCVGMEVTDRIRYVVDCVEKATGLEHFGQYLTMMLEMDWLFLNEDRHFNNIAVIRNSSTNEYRLCPIFDNGAALLSDTTIDHPLDGDVYKSMKKTESKPFSFDFEEQVDAAERLYGKQMQYWFENKDIEQLIDQASTSGLFSKETTSRVEMIAKTQRKNLQYLQANDPIQKLSFAKEEKELAFLHDL